MSTIDKIIDGSNQNKNAAPTCIAASSLEPCAEGNNTSYRLYASHNSTSSNECDLSLLSLSLDKEIDAITHTIDMDELPVFEIRLISPLGRTPSPIDTEDVKTPARPIALKGEVPSQNPCINNPEFVALHDINAQISPPSDNGYEEESALSRTCSLETIYEGVFLNTPPRQRLSLQCNRNIHSRSNLLEKVAHNRLNVGKENESPTTKCKKSPQRQSLDFGYKT